MDDPITKARQFSEKLRYPGDKKFSRNNLKFSDFSSSFDHNLRNGLLVGASTTPSLEKTIIRTCERLFLPRSSVSVFVFASSQIQATCQSISEQECIVQLSSALVNLLTEDEVSFVIGHELGHHTLCHFLTNGQHDSLELHMQKRAQEISVDRLGLIGCSNLNVATSALIKTVSGLNDNHLKLDVRGFLDQAKSLKNPIHGEGYLNTHPSILVRCRALLWFSQISDEINETYDELAPRLSVVNKRVEAELAKFVEAPTINFIKSVTTGLSMWMAAKHVLAKGVFNKPDQSRFVALYGLDNINKFKALIKNESKKDVTEFVEGKIAFYQDKLCSLVPNSYKEHLKDVERQLFDAFKD